mgnify:FL=1
MMEMCGFLYLKVESDNAHLCIFQEQDLISIMVKGYLGLEVGNCAGDLENLALSEAVVLDTLADFEVGHRGGDEIGVGNLWRQRPVPQSLYL